MASPLEELKNIRMEKLRKLISSGVLPYAQPSLIKRQLIRDVNKKGLDLEVFIAGRIKAVRSHGGSTFLDLTDSSARIQLFLSEEVLGKDRYGFLSLLDIGDFVSVSGILFKTKAGELTVNVSNINLLTKSLHPIPSAFYGLKDVEERYRQRYLDLIINSEIKKIFETRARVIKNLRSILDGEDFIEVETPVLQPIYGGATAKPFTTHHNSLDTNLYLRISDELYLKRLIVGSFEKVYEIGKDFRNEGIDRQHNPEFTMLEFYWAYSTYEELMDFTEKMLSEVVRNVTGSYKVTYESKEIDFTPPWPRVTFREAILTVSGLDIDKVKDEKGLLNFVKEKDIQIDLKGVVGFAPLLDTLYKKIVRPTLTGPLFLIDHPYQMRPLAKRKKEDPTKAASFQLIVAGIELVNAYNELNDPIEQKNRWKEEMNLASKGLDEYQIIDEDYIRALEYGMPPTSGWGMGVDRFVTLLTGSHTIKDVIFFPTLRPENLDVSVSDVSSVSDIPSEKTSFPLEPSGSFPSREKVFQIVSTHIKNQNLLRHCLAVEAAMRALARKFGGNEEAWGALGLIHDADWEETKNDPDRHTVAALEWLSLEGFSEGPIVQGLKSHNTRHTKLSEIQSIMEWALETCDELTGFIVSVALVRPDKKLSSVEVESVLKKWKNKDFAAAVNRSQIGQCEEKLGIKLDEFIQLILEAMKDIAPEIGL